LIHNDSTLPRGNDEVSPAIILAKDISFFEETARRVYVSTNVTIATYIAYTENTAALCVLYCSAYIHW